MTQIRTDGGPLSLLQITKDEYPEIYAQKESEAGPAGTVLALRPDTFHSGTSMTAPRGARFVERATCRQLELVGFPPRGHRYWAEQMWSAVCQRDPSVNFSGFASSQTAPPWRLP